MHADLLSSPPPRTPHRMAHRPRSRPRGLTAATLLAATLALVIGVGPAAGDPGADFSALLLYPDIHKDFVVFVYGEDLWRAPADGGDARRLTAHAGQELFPKISPDGRWIAFSAQYTGTRQVWVMPSEGGDPRQLTFYSDVGDMPPRGGYDYWIQGWSPDGKILVRMNRTPWFERMGRYFLVDPEGGLETPIPHIPHGGSASFSPDGKALAYTPIDREFRTWKHSLGGRAQDVWIYDLAGNASRRLTTYRGTDNFPMWSGDRIYFTSDRDFTLELFAYDLSSEEVRPVTTAGDTEWDLLWPSLGPENVVFTRGGRLYRMSLADEAVSPILIRVGGARPGAVPAFDDVSDNLGDASLSPNGKRVVFDARGDLFSVPAEHGPTRNLTRSQGVREHSPSWSPDGQWIAYLSDASGEYELYLLPRSGGEPRQLTNDGEVWRFAPVWSPDSKRLAYADRKRRLMVVDVATGEQTEA
ncbi:MAG: protease, partial [Acidobacteriota bacterium]